MTIKYMKYMSYKKRNTPLLLALIRRRPWNQAKFLDSPKVGVNRSDRIMLMMIIMQEQVFTVRYIMPVSYMGLLRIEQCRL